MKTIPPTVLLAAAVLALGACGESLADRTASALDADLRRERALALYTEDRYAEAFEALAPLVERPDAELDDLLRAALSRVGRADGTLMSDPQAELDAAWQLLERAARLAPDDPRVSYQRGYLLLMHHVEQEARAAEEFRRALASSPQDAPTHWWLAEALDRLGDIEGAGEQLLAIVDAGVEAGGSYYVTAQHKRMQYAYRRRDREEAVRIGAEIEALKARSLQPASERQLRLGPLATFDAPRPTWAAAREPAAAALTFAPATTAPLPAAEHLLAADVDGDGHLDLLAWGRAGARLSRQPEAGRFLPPAAFTGGPDRLLEVCLADLDRDLGAGQPPGALELLTLEDLPEGRLVRLWALQRDPEAWVPFGPGVLPGDDPRHVTASDFDHDGDLDVLVASGRQGLRILRNDLTGGLHDATPAAAAALGECLEVLPEDVDGDNDVDLLVRTSAGLAILSNERGGDFLDESSRWQAPAVSGPLRALDLDGDGRMDLVWAAPDGALHWSRFDGVRFAPAAALPGARAPDGGFDVADMNQDGWPDLLLPGGAAAGLDVLLGPLGSGSERGPLVGVSGLPAGVLGTGRLLVADLLGRDAPPPDAVGLRKTASGDGRLELALAREAGVDVLAAGAVRGVSIALSGDKDNHAGTGAIVELRAAGRYQRVYWRGTRQVLGLDGEPQVTFVRVTWPNGVVQNTAFALASGESMEILQVDRQAGSCPFLYAWDGRRWNFVSDVLGATPLGLPMGRDGLLPFDHDEYVKVRGELLAADGGRLRLALTEELREVTYLDRARLHVIDHPAQTEIQPNEAFVLPFPEHHVHALTEVLPPARALANRDEGLAAPEEDVTELLASVDTHGGRPFVALRGQFQGLCEPWTLDLAFGRDEAELAAIRRAPKLRLLLTGWVRWGDASVNTAIANHPTLAFRPPVLWLPDGAGWREGPGIGFPAGKTKTMVVDVSTLLDRDDPRLRLATTLEITWDSIRLCIDGDDAPWQESVLEVEAADLRFRGFSSIVETGRPDLPELFDWQLPEGFVPWNQHPGAYTRYGEVRELLAAVEDRYVILGAGDCIELSFDARALPELPAGSSRSYLLYLDGWAKDGDPNTAASQHVLPLPFHGMSTYPPPAGESFPDSPEHRAWQEQWNTRPGRRLIEP